MPAYERLVGAWDFDGDDATDAITWLMSLLTRMIDDDVPTHPADPPTRAGSYHHRVSAPPSVYLAGAVTVVVVAVAVVAVTQERR